MRHAHQQPPDKSSHQPPSAETEVPTLPEQEIPEIDAPTNQETSQRVQKEGIRRSRRVRHAPKRYADYAPHGQVVFKAFTVPKSKEEPQEGSLLALKTLHDPHTLYLWEAAKEPDFTEFHKEIDFSWSEKIGSCVVEQIFLKCGHAACSLVYEAKRRISTREVYKWKAHINMDGSKQVYRMHYEEMYSSIVAWATTRFFPIRSLLNKWHTLQLDFVMVFPQAPASRERLYMEIPKGVNIEDPADARKAHPKHYVLYRY
jgi:hypothetical protein